MTRSMPSSFHLNNGRARVISSRTNHLALKTIPLFSNYEISFIINFVLCIFTYLLKPVAHFTQTLQVLTCNSGQVFVRGTVFQRLKSFENCHDRNSQPYSQESEVRDLVFICNMQGCRRHAFMSTCIENHCISYPSKIIFQT